MVDARAARLRRALFCAGLAAAVWALVATMTGGATLWLGPLRISSRNPRNPILLSILTVALAWVLAPAGQRTASVVLEWRWAMSRAKAWARWAWHVWTTLDAAVASRTPPRLAPALVGVIAVAVVAIAFRYGALVAAGADASGYVTHAEIWAAGTLRVEPPLMRELTPGIPPDAFAPLAYRVAPDGIGILPVTAPGLPMLMALVSHVAGARAMYWVVPAMAAVAVVATYLLGCALIGRWAGVGAAALLAASPSFLFQLTSSPMSDIPASAWWALSLALALGGGRWSAWGSGLSAGAAILTRPNLVPLAAIPALWLAVDVWRERSAHRVLLFAAGVVPACLAIAALYTFWYGSPLSSGYGTLEDLYRWVHVPANLARYPRWIVESQTPVVALGIVTPLLLLRGGAPAADAPARAAILLAFAIAVLCCYLSYVPFEAWWFVRFLLPGYAPMLVLTSAAILLIVPRVLPAIRISATLAVLALVMSSTLAYARAASAFDVRGEWKYKEAGVHVATHVPERAVVLAAQHSGSVRHYARRPTLRYTAIPGDRLDWVIGETRRLGYDAYLLLEDWEEEEFATRFQGQEALRILTTGPVADVTGGDVPIYRVRLYKLE